MSSRTTFIAFCLKAVSRVSLALILTACYSPSASRHSTVDEIRYVRPTAAVPTSAVPTLAPTPTATPAPTHTPSPVPPTREPCVYDAEFVRDVTYADGAQVKPGRTIQKTWILKNVGTCDWGAEVRVSDVGSGTLFRLDNVLVPLTEPNAEASVSAMIPAPQSPGAYTKTYQLCAPDGCFGPRFWVKIQVSSTSNRMPTARPTTTERRPTAPPAPPPAPAWQGHTCDHCIKGNIAYETGERIYHIPGCEYYNETRINTAYGERWFSSEAEAIAAGWRKAKNCP